MQRSAWIPNSTDIWSEKEALTVSTVALSKCCSDLCTVHTKRFQTKYTASSFSQPHQRAAQGDCPHSPWQREKQPDPYRGGSPGCTRSQEGAAWACVTHGRCKLKFAGNVLLIGPRCAHYWTHLSLAGERAYKGLDHWTAFSQSHHWPKRGEDKRSTGQIPRGESAVLGTWCWLVPNLLNVLV